MKIEGIATDIPLAMAGAMVGYLLGGWTAALGYLLTLQGIDIVTGIFQAANEKKLNSTDMRQGIYRKLGVWFLLILANFADELLFDGQGIATTAITFTFIGQEGISIIENLANIGLPIPDQLTQFFSKIQGKGDSILGDQDDEIQG